MTKVVTNLQLVPCFLHLSLILAIVDCTCNILFVTVMNAFTVVDFQHFTW